MVGLELAGFVSFASSVLPVLQSARLAKRNRKLFIMKFEIGLLTTRVTEPVTREEAVEAGGDRRRGYRARTAGASAEGRARGAGPRRAGRGCAGAAAPGGPAGPRAGGGGRGRGGWPPPGRGGDRTRKRNRFGRAFVRGFTVPRSPRSAAPGPAPPGGSTK